MGQSAALLPHPAASAAVNGTVCPLCVGFQQILFPQRPAVPPRVLAPRTLDIPKPACVSPLLFFFIYMATSESHVYRTELYVGAFFLFFFLLGNGDATALCSCGEDLFFFCRSTPVCTVNRIFVLVIILNFNALLDNCIYLLEFWEVVPGCNM